MTTSHRYSYCISWCHNLNGVTMENVTQSISEQAFSNFQVKSGAFYSSSPYSLHQAKKMRPSWRAISFSPMVAYENVGPPNDGKNRSKRRHWVKIKSISWPPCSITQRTISTWSLKTRSYTVYCLRTNGTWNEPWPSLTIAKKRITASFTVHLNPAAIYSAVKTMEAQAVTLTPYCLPCISHWR